MARTAVVGFCCSETKMKELKASSQPGSSRALWGYGPKPFPDLSFEFYSAHHCQVFKPSPCTSSRWTCQAPTPHHHHPDGKKRVSSIIRSSGGSREAYVISFEAPTSPGLNVSTTGHCKEADGSPHSRCNPGPPLSERAPAWATSTWGHTGCHLVALCAALWGLWPLRLKEWSFRVQGWMASRALNKVLGSLSVHRSRKLRRTVLCCSPPLCPTFLGRIQATIRNSLIPIKFSIVWVIPKSLPSP